MFKKGAEMAGILTVVGLILNLIGTLLLLRAQQISYLKKGLDI